MNCLAGREFRLAVAWTEFLNGPVTAAKVGRAEAVLQSRIVPFSQAEAVMAAELFNKTGQRRGSRTTAALDY